jgi:hypothetical protein
MATEGQIPLPVLNESSEHECCDDHATANNVEGLSVDESADQSILANVPVQR